MKRASASPPVRPQVVSDSGCTIADLNARHVDEMRRRLSYVRALDGLGPDCRDYDGTKAAIAAVGAARGDDDVPSPSTVERWRNRFHRGGGWIAALMDGRAARTSGWAPWVEAAVDEAAAFGRHNAHLRPSLTKLAQMAQERCRAASRMHGSSEVPAFATLCSMIRRRWSPIPIGRERYAIGTIGERPLGTVAVVQQILARPVRNVDVERVYVTLAQDAYSGLIVAATLATTQAEGAEILGLLGATPALTNRSILGAVRACLAVPETIVVDRAMGFDRKAVQRVSTLLGVAVCHASSGAVRVRGGIPSGLDDWIAGRDQEVATPDDLMAAVVGWLCHHDSCPGKSDADSPVERWRKGVARHGLRMPTTARGEVGERRPGPQPDPSI